MKKTLSGTIAALSLLLTPLSMGATVVGEAIQESQIATIIAELKQIHASSELQFREKIAKEISQINQLISVAQNTYSSVDQIINSNNILDAVYGGANLLSNGSLLGSSSEASKAFRDVSSACSTLMSEYSSYLGACQYFASVDRNFDFNGACSNVQYLSSIIQGTFEDVDEISDIIKKYKTNTLQAREQLEEVTAKIEGKAAAVQKAVGLMCNEHLYKMQGECLANALSPGTAASDFRTVGTDGGTTSSVSSSGGSALKSSSLTYGSGSSSDAGTGSLSPYDSADAMQELKNATPLVLDIASILTFVLGMLFTVRNYARKHSGEHGSANALLKVLVGTFVIIAIIQIVRAFIV